MSKLPITHVATTDIHDMMNPGPERRMDLPGFDAEFVDLPHYIIRITERIWHDREVDLCLDYYGEDCAIHTLAGDIAGAQTVVNNTNATLAAFPDRRLDGDNVIWSTDGKVYYSSHLITSKMTNLGDSEFGPATGKAARVLTIADCVCFENRIIEEWLVRDNLGLVQQLGHDADTVARNQAAADQERGFSLTAFHSAERQTIQAGPLVTDDMKGRALTPAAAAGIKALDHIWNQRSLDGLEDLYDFRVSAHMPGAEDLYGPDQLAAFLQPLLSAITETTLQVQHIAEIEYLGGAKDVALRWAVSGKHSGEGRYGDPTGADILIMGVTQVRVMKGRIREEWTVWDDIAVRRQIEEARLAE